jgi:hypothetical protein
MLTFISDYHVQVTPKRTRNQARNASEASGILKVSKVKLGDKSSYIIFQYSSNHVSQEQWESIT